MGMWVYRFTKGHLLREREVCQAQAEGQLGDLGLASMGACGVGLGWEGKVGWDVPYLVTKDSAV